jgi:hypothetical protein
MNRRHCQPAPAEHSCGTPRGPRLLHRMRNAAAFAQRSMRRKVDTAKSTVPAIEDQLQTLHPICSAQRVSTGITCGAPAVAVAEIHAIDGCNQMGLTPGGNLVETLCHCCLVEVRSAVAAYVGDKCEMAARCGTHPMCTSCGRPTRTLASVFSLSHIKGDGLAL